MNRPVTRLSRLMTLPVLYATLGMILAKGILVDIFDIGRPAAVLGLIYLVLLWRLTRPETIEETCSRLWREASLWLDSCWQARDARRRKRHHAASRRVLFILSRRR